MKFLFGIVIFCFLAEFSNALNMEEATQMFTAAAKTCKGLTGVSEDDIERIKKHELVESREGKCFATCVVKSLNLMTPDNKPNKEVMMIGIAMMTKDNPECAKKAEEIVDECINVTDPDECEASYKIAVCLKAGKEARGLVFDM